MLNGFVCGDIFDRVEVDDNALVGLDLEIEVAAGLLAQIEAEFDIPFTGWLRNRSVEQVACR